jgi:transposase-like protein
MPDNWSFVAAAYGLTAAVLLLYWRRLARKERELRALKRSNAERGRGRLTAEQNRERLTAERSGLNAERSHEPSRTGHPRPEPNTRPPLQ